MSLVFQARSQCFIFFFALESIMNRWIDLEVNQSVYSIPFCESLNETLFVLVYSTYKIAGHTHVERSTGPAREDVNVILPHR